MLSALGWTWWTSARTRAQASSTRLRRDLGARRRRAASACFRRRRKPARRPRHSRYARRGGTGSRRRMGTAPRAPGNWRRCRWTPTTPSPRSRTSPRRRRRAACSIRRHHRRCRGGWRPRSPRSPWDGRQRHCRRRSAWSANGGTPPSRQCEEMVLPVRIELTTSALPRMRSTTELRQHCRGGTRRLWPCGPQAVKKSA